MAQPTIDPRPQEAWIGVGMEQECQNPCLFRYTWPGRDESFVCLEHAQKLLNVAGAIGMHLQLIQYEPPHPATEWPNCKQKVKP